MNFQKIGAGIAAGALLTVLCAASAFADTITVSGNGSASDNDVTLTSHHSTTINQSNHSEVSTQINQHNNTGHNNANDNTGGDTFIGTGNASANAGVTVDGNTNEAFPPDCGCNGSTDVTVSGNGSFSDTDVTVHQQQNKSVWQSNTSFVWTSLHQKNNTGKNNANDNTDGSSTVWTGDASSWASVHVGGSHNTQ